MSLLTRLRSFAALPRGERALALRAIWTLLAVRVGLSLLPFARLRERVERAGVADGLEDAESAQAVRRAVDRAARTIPGSACLAQAFTAEVMLRRAGLRVSTSLGVSSQGAPLPAHAWVESAGVIVAGDASNLDAYVRLITFGAQPKDVACSPLPR